MNFPWLWSSQNYFSWPRLDHYLTEFRPNITTPKTSLKQVNISQIYYLMLYIIFYHYHLSFDAIWDKYVICLQVQDKSYFLGLLRTRIAELGTEMSRLGSEIELMKQEQSTFLTYDKRVKEMAQELTGQLIYAAFVFMLRVWNI